MSWRMRAQVSVPRGPGAESPRIALSATRSVPLVSIGIPTYNRPVGLARTLKYITQQTYKNLEILVSDNCSPDPEVQQVVARFCAGDSRVKYFRQEENLGPSQNFQFVLQRATADYFMWAADDDHWEPGFIAALVTLLEAQPECVLAFCDFDAINAAGERIESYPDFLPQMMDYSGRSLSIRLHRYLAQDEAQGKANLMYGLYRRTTLLAAGGIKIWGLGTWGADMLITFRILSIGDLALCPDLLFHVGVGDRAASAAFAENTECNRKPLWTKSKRVLQVAKGLCSRFGYYVGYIRITLIATGLTKWERISLVQLALARFFFNAKKRSALR